MESAHCHFSLPSPSRSFSWLTQPFRGQSNMFRQTYVLAHHWQKIMLLVQSCASFPSSHPVLLTSVDETPKLTCPHTPTHTYIHTCTACCTTSSLEAGKHLSTSLQSKVAVGCRRAMSEAHSGRILRLSVGCSMWARKHVILTEEGVRKTVNYWGFLWCNQSGCGVQYSKRSMSSGVKWP